MSEGALDSAPSALAAARAPVAVDRNNRGELSNGFLTAGVSITPDGRYVLFQSDAANLPGPTLEDSAQGVYLYRRDQQTGQVVLAIGSNGPNVCHAQWLGVGSGRVLTPDGRYVVYVSSQACGDTPGFPGNAYQVLVYDIASGTTRAASVDATGTYGNASSDSPSISDDGRYVAFSSGARNLQPPGSHTSHGHVFVHDMTTGTTRLVDQAADGTASDATYGSTTGTSSLSGDGHKLVYNIRIAATNDTSLRLADLITGSDRRILNTGSFGGISRDGRYVTGNIKQGDAYPPVLLDLSTGKTNRSSLPQAGGPYTSCGTANISPTNRYLTYRCSTPGDPNRSALFRRDLRSGTVTRIDTLPDTKPSGTDLVFLHATTNEGAVLITSEFPGFVPAGSPSGLHVLLATPGR